MCPSEHHMSCSHVELQADGEQLVGDKMEVSFFKALRGQDDERRWSDRRGSRRMENDLTVIAVCRSEERQAANKKVTKNIRSVGKSALACVEKDNYNSDESGR